MVTREGYKYHHYVGHEPELFHLDADPEELVDLAQDRRHEAVRKDLERELCGLLDPLAVDRRAKRDQNDLVIRFGGREKALARGNKGPTPMHDKYRMA
jgi:choline-sulfatase